MWANSCDLTASEDMIVRSMYIDVKIRRQYVSCLALSCKSTTK